MAIIPANVNQLDLKAVFELNKFYLTLIITVYIYICMMYVRINVLKPHKLIEC